MYNPRIPISSGRNYPVVDSRDKEGSKPLWEALNFIGQNLQNERSYELAKEGMEIDRNLAKAKIQSYNRPQGMNGQIVVDKDGNTLVVDKRTGTVQNTGIKADSKVAGMINAMSRFWNIPGGVVPEQDEQAITQWGVGEIKRRAGMPKSPISQALESKPTTGKWDQSKKVLKKKVESKTRPPKPKEYPNAQWNEEHGMWTIVKNGRLMGIKE